MPWYTIVCSQYTIFDNEHSRINVILELHIYLSTSIYKNHIYIYIYIYIYTYLYVYIRIYTYIYTKWTKTISYHADTRY